MWAATHVDEVVFRDTAHGLVTWADATLATAVFVGSAGTSLIRGAAKEAPQRRGRDADPLRPLSRLH